MRGSVFLVLLFNLWFAGLQPTTGNVLFLDGLYQNDSLTEKAELNVLFKSTDILKFSLTVEDMRALKKDVGDDPSWHKGYLSYYTPDSLPVILQVKVQARGHFRKDPANCNFPPLRLNFKKKEVKNTLFDGQNKIKLVTHCRNRPDHFSQYVQKEYLAYRIYNVITERSFRVRLAEIEYIDGRDRVKTIKKYGFFIEDTRDMAERNGFTHVKVDNIPQEYLDFFYQDLLSVFQYMIGNTDWSVPARHNVKILQEKPELRPVAVPYDFDWSGLVNPLYAKPSKKLGIETVEQRIFRGFEKNVEDYHRIFQLFIDRQDEIYALLDECRLNERHYKMTRHYIDDFYKVIKNEKLIEREFIHKARTPNSDYWGK